MDPFLLEKHDTASLAQEIENGYKIDEEYIFELEDENEDNVTVTRK